MEGQSAPAVAVSAGLASALQDGNRPSTMIQAQDVNVNDGDFTLAGRDVHSHRHYHLYPSIDVVDLTPVLRKIRNFRKIHLDMLAKATPGTGIWLIESETFRLWLDVNGTLKILWGTGIREPAIISRFTTCLSTSTAGAGKTVIASIVINELEARARHSKDSVCVAYVYLRYSEHSGATVRSVLEVLVRQTLERHKAFEEVVKQVYAHHLSEDTQPTEVELLHLLQEFSTATKATFYILDALDEAPVEIQVDLIKKLATLNARLFITSRPLKGVENRIPGVCGFQIVAQDHDIDLHIATEIDRSPDLQDLLERGDGSLRGEVVSSIKRNCGRMFLHASLQLDALRHCLSIHEVKQTLEEFPSQIEDAYHQTWDRICSQHTTHASHAKMVLVWVLHATGSMTVNELAQAVASSPETYEYEPERTISNDTLVTLCRGLITFEEESQLVRLVHYTAKETLQRLLEKSFPCPHAHLAAVCMTHLAKHGFQNSQFDSEEAFDAVLKANPLLTYAYDAWAMHARESLSIESFASQVADFVAGCQAFPARYTFHSTPGSGSFDLLSPLHVVAYYDLPLSLIISRDLANPNLVTKRGQMTPLCVAASRGSNGAVQSLLAVPHTLINKPDGAGRTPLILCAAQHKSILQLLLAAPNIKVNLVDHEGWSAVMEAAARGHEENVELLLAAPEILTDLEGETTVMSALILACYENREAIVELILAQLVASNFYWHAVDIPLSGLTSPLVGAAGLGFEGIVALLLAHATAVTANLIDGTEMSALMAAAHHGHQGIVQLLLSSSKVDVNRVDPLGRSALVFAASQGQEEILETLLAHPKIDVNLKSGAALMEAARYDRGGVVKRLLLCPKTRVNCADERKRSALMMAVWGGSETAVAHLLAHPKVEVNATDVWGWSALMMASYHGNEGSVKLILRTAEVDVNLVNDHGRSALMLAASKGYTTIVALLLTSPRVDANLLDKSGCTALTIAINEHFHGIVVQLLALAEVNVNIVPGAGGWSALMAAADQDLEDIVALLLARRSTNVNIADSRGRTALMLSARRGHTATTTLLLAHPETEVNLLSEREDWSALMFAAHHGHEDIVALFLGHATTDVNLLNGIQTSALILACEEGHEGVVKALLTHPATLINSVDHLGWPPLMKAARKGHLGIVKLLLASTDIDVNLANITMGWRALNLASLGGHHEIVRLLVAHPSIKVNLANRHFHLSALMCAARNGNGTIVSDLLAHEEVEINLTDSRGWSALMHAARTGNICAMKPLLAHPQIEINLTDREGWSPLMKAAWNGHKDIVALLVASPKLRFDFVDSMGRSALLLAIFRKDMAIVELILSHPGAHVNLVDRDGWSPLMRAACTGQVGITQLLLSYPEVDINFVGNKGWSTLMHAAYHGHKAVVESLLAHPKIEVNLVDGEGRSALMLSALAGHGGTTALIRSVPGIDINRCDRDGSTALGLASHLGHSVVVKLLLTTPEVDVNCSGRLGDTALKAASEAGHEDIVRMLLTIQGVDITIKSARDGHTAVSIAKAACRYNIARMLYEFADAHLINPADVEEGYEDARGTAVANISDSEKLVGPLFFDVLAICRQNPGPPTGTEADMEGID